MKRLIIVLISILMFSCENIEDIVEPEVINEECERLTNGDYDSFPDDECRCVYIRDGDVGIQDSYTFSHKWTPLEYRMYLDSMICGYKVIDYGDFDIIKDNVIIDDATLECDC